MNGSTGSSRHSGSDSGVASATQNNKGTKVSNQPVKAHKSREKSTALAKAREHYESQVRLFVSTLDYICQWSVVSLFYSFQLLSLWSTSFGERISLVTSGVNAPSSMRS